MTRRQEEFKDKVSRMDIPELTIRSIQLEERHRTIMRVWNDQSTHKVHLELKEMYNELWDEFEPIKQRLKKIYSHEQ